MIPQVSFAYISPGEYEVEDNVSRFNNHALRKLLLYYCPFYLSHSTMATLVLVQKQDLAYLMSITIETFVRVLLQTFPCIHTIHFRPYVKTRFTLNDGLKHAI